MNDDASNRDRPILVLLTSHWLSLLGLGLVVTALCSWLFLLPLQMRGESDNPYLGLLAFVAIPLVLFAGLAIVPLGVFLARRRVRRGFAQMHDRRTARSRLLVAFGVATLVNIAIGTQATYRAVKHMETPQFCGSCHVMAPQLAGHRESPHARVECAACHVGDGASGWFASKLNGARQLFELVTGRFPRPVPSALATDKLVPAKQTCEECHWRSKPGEVRLKVISSFADDEANTPSETVLTLHVGGKVLGGIHGAHNDEDVEIRFAARDDNRQEIVWVEKRELKTGASKVWLKNGETAESTAGLKRITMQCVDCHNRVGHDFMLAARAVDASLATGKLPTSLPYIKKRGVELLSADYSSAQEAEFAIRAGLESFFKENHPDVAEQRAADIASSAAELTRLWVRNVFPEFKVTWGTYPSNMGHTDSPGCFRCHNGDHKGTDDKVISNNCNACHFAPAIDEEEPEILGELGLTRTLMAPRRE